MGGELDLPKPVIQRIQYFLTGKQAAVTAILSKPWYRAWRTRPNIDLDENDYPRYYGADTPDILAFPRLVKKTVQRYEESNIEIDSFSLRLASYGWDGSGFAVYKKMIVKALKMGVHRLLLSTRMDYVLPNEVFAAKKTCWVICGRVQNCSGAGAKDLSLSDIYEYKDNDKPGMSSVGYSYGYGYGYGYRYGCGYGKRVLGTGLSLGPIDLPNLHNIRCLVLSCVDFDILFLGDLSSKFPSLRDLTLKYYTIFVENIRISSHSLELLNFNVESPTMRVEFDVPSIRKFTFEGPLIESLSFKTTSREWESHLSIICTELSTSWFLELSKLASQFSQSKLHLSCRVFARKSFDYEVEDLQDLPKLQVENLTMETQGLPTLNCFALFDGLFRICRPNFITQYLLPMSTAGWKKNNYYLCKTLVQQINEKCSFETLGMHSLDDLKQVNAQVFDEVVAEWQEIPLKSLLVASPSPKETQKIRFGMEWKA